MDGENQRTNTGRRCCNCSSPQHSCIKCQCVRNNRQCIDCKIGYRCRNRAHSDVSLEFFEIGTDGNCLFRCIALALYKDQERHRKVREDVCNHMSENYEYSEYVEGDYDMHVENMKKDRVWGEYAQIRAIANIYKIQIFVYTKIGKHMEWIPGHCRVEDNHQCDHSKEYIALDYRDHHYRLVKTKTKPLCECEHTIDNVDEKEHEENAEMSDESYGEYSDHEFSDDIPYTWYGIESKDLEIWVEEIYQEIVLWNQKNLFEPPICQETKDMIQLMADLIEGYVEDAKYANIAIKFFMIIPTVFLQKISKHPSGKQNIKSLRRRLDHLKNNSLDKLIQEMKTVRRCHNSSKKVHKKSEEKVKEFSKLMKKGRVRNSLRLISKEGSNGPLQLTAEVREELRKKHPKAVVAEKEVKIQEQSGSEASYLFEGIDEMMVWNKALKTQGGAGPSGLNADLMKNLLSSKKHGVQAKNLRIAISKLAQKLATENCQNLDAFTARRLLPLMKRPKGVRPIGIGEIINRIIGKCIMQISKEEVKRAAGNLQVCAGQQGGGEAAIHAMSEIFQESEVDAVILVDAKNAFNNINRDAMLHNIKMRCPTLSRYVENTYGTPSDLFIEGGDNVNDVIKSEEGTTQGDPVAMAMYAIGLSVLQDSLAFEKTNIKSVAYADDYIGAGTIQNLHEWWYKLENMGKKFGYITNAEKSWLIVKPAKEEAARELFKNSSIQITSEGHEHLGAVIGSEQFKNEYVKMKVEEWKTEVLKLSEIAKTEPHAAYTAFTHGLKHKWTYVSRTIPEISELMEPLEEAIQKVFIPAITNRECTELERDLLSLPPKLGGLGIINPMRKPEPEYKNSTKMTKQLSEFIINQDKHGEVDEMEINNIRKQISSERDKMQIQEMEQIKEACSAELKRKIQLATETGASNWLTSLPIKAKGFSLTRQEFNDAIALRYGWSIEGLPDICPGCSETFNESHANTCQTGGYIAMRHDEIRDLTFDMLREVCRCVDREPGLQSCSGFTFQHKSAKSETGARVDLSAIGFWNRGEKAFFDVRIFEPSARTYDGKSIKWAYEKNEKDKTREYGERIQRVEQGTFTPLVFSTSGGMAHQCKIFYNKIAKLMAEKKGEPKGFFTAWMRVKISFALLRSSLLCLRGTRSSKKNYISLRNIDYDAEAIQSRIGKSGPLR